MNIRQGMFRLWVVASVLFVIALGMLSYSGIRQEFKEAGTDYDALAKKYGGYPVYHLDCQKARGTAGTDYTVSNDLCWYKMEDFRRVFPEYKSVDDKTLSEALYTKAGQQSIRPPHPWIKVLKTAAVAFAVPLAVLVLGWSLFWAFAGFRSSPTQG